MIVKNDKIVKDEIVDEGQKKIMISANSLNITQNLNKEEKDYTNDGKYVTMNPLNMRDDTNFINTKIKELLSKSNADPNITIDGLVKMCIEIYRVIIRFGRIEYRRYYNNSGSSELKKSKSTPVIFSHEKLKNNSTYMSLYNNTSFINKNEYKDKPITDASINKLINDTIRHALSTSKHVENITYNDCHTNCYSDCHDNCHGNSCNCVESCHSNGCFSCHYDVNCVSPGGGGCHSNCHYAHTCHSDCNCVDYANSTCYTNNSVCYAAPGSCQSGRPDTSNGTKGTFCQHVKGSSKHKDPKIIDHNLSSYKEFHPCYSDSGCKKSGDTKKPRPPKKNEKVGKKPGGGGSSGPKKPPKKNTGGGGSKPKPKPCRSNTCRKSTCRSSCRKSTCRSGGKKK